MLKAVIFDLDGLLVDSTPLQQEANRIFIESFGKIYLFPKSSREGMRIIDIVRDYKDIFELPGSVEELYAKRQEIFFALASQQLQLFPGVWPLFEKLKKRKLMCALATSGDQDYVDLVFAKFPHFKENFPVVVTSEEVVRGKPFPEVYFITLQKLQLKPTEVLVLEDSFNGIAAAKAAGIQAICIPNKNYPDADITQADKTFTSLIEFTKHIPG